MRRRRPRGHRHADVDDGTARAGRRRRVALRPAAGAECRRALGAGAVFRGQARRAARSPCAPQRHRRQSRTQSQGGSGRIARHAHRHLDGHALVRRARAAGAGAAGTAGRGRMRHARARMENAGAPAFRPASGGAAARGTAAVRPPEESRGPDGAARRGGQPRRRTDDAGLLPLGRDDLAHQRPLAAAFRGAVVGGGDAGAGRGRFRVASWLPGDDRARPSRRRHGRDAVAVRPVGAHRKRARPALGNRARAGRIAAVHQALSGAIARSARAVSGRPGRTAGGDHAHAHGAPGRVGALPAGIRQGVGPHAVRPVPCLYGRPAHADRAAHHGRIPQRPGARVRADAGSGGAIAQAVPAAARRPVP